MQIACICGDPFSILRGESGAAAYMTACLKERRRLISLAAVRPAFMILARYSGVSRSLEYSMPRAATTRELSWTGKAKDWVCCTSTETWA